LLGLAGFACHGPQKLLGFAPRITPGLFRTAFTTADAWGTYAQQRGTRRQDHSLDVKWGSLALRTLTLELPEGVRLHSVKITGSQVACESQQNGTTVQIRFAEDVVIPAGSRLSIELVG
jgi:hypothetical protein